MRYAGQNYELPIPLGRPPRRWRQLDCLPPPSPPHRRLYGFAAEDEPIQLVTFRVEASAIVPKATFARASDAGPDASGAIVDTSRGLAAGGRRLH